jgi:hypothetical protein
MKYPNIREEELKNKVAQDYFWLYDCSKIIGNVDFCVQIHNDNPSLFEQESLLWAEAKTGTSDIYKSLVQLILTIGKARTFDKFLPPAMLGAFDGEKIAFIAYNDIHEIFYLNDFNWNVTPSNHNSKEFKLLYDKVKSAIDSNALLFNYLNDESELKKFIKHNFIVGKFGLTKTKIDKNNFMVIYNKWLQAVKPTIQFSWDIAKKAGLIDGDFYLADLLSIENKTLKDKLFVILSSTKYELNRHKDEYGAFTSSTVYFTDNQVAHTQFWNKYERPPKEEYWDYIVERRDLLVPQDVRERKGSFFTPQIWVELSQKYLTDTLGEDWQDEYYIWDCAAGTGNLVNGLTNKYNIWASTLDKQDVEVMHDRIKNGANLLDDHVFQFDFLNDDFSKLPRPLQEIINNEEKRKKLVIYINPPYAEASSYGEESIPQVSKGTKVFNDYKNIVGAEAVNELFAQFLIRIYKEIPNVTIGVFSTPKYITSEKFIKFRATFLAKYMSGFICPADTFDNVKGKFPISYLIWKLDEINQITEINTDIYEEVKDKAIPYSTKQKSFSISNNKTITEWRSSFYTNTDSPIGYMIIVGPSMQSNNNTFFTNKPTDSYIKKGMTAKISATNLIEMAIYLAVRHSVETNWINNKDVLLSPSNEIYNDIEFQNDCFVFSLFDNTNNVSSKLGINHWIPFTEQEVNAREKFESNFMTDFIKGKPLPPQKSKNTLSILFEPEVPYNRLPLTFSIEATAVFYAGRELWKYYHKQPNCNVNASLYDIREHFQGRNEAGKMNNKSLDDTYMNLIGNLREKLKQLANKIEPKVYEYGFLQL